MYHFWRRREKWGITYPLVWVLKDKLRKSREVDKELDPCLWSEMVGTTESTGLGNSTVDA